jgi:hypothetical protein
MRSALGEKLVQLKPAEVGSFKIGQCAESLDILDHHSLPLDSDQIVFAELPQRAADVLDAQAERIADQFLGQRHLQGAVICRPIACSLVNSSSKKCAIRSSADRVR